MIDSIACCLPRETDRNRTACVCVWWDGALLDRWLGAHLAVDERGDGEVPRGVGGHAEPQEGPDPVVVEGRDEHRGGAAGAEDVRPCPLVQPVVDVVDVAARRHTQRCSVSPRFSSPVVTLWMDAQ
jgi:hypothetical protein